MTFSKLKSFASVAALSSALTLGQMGSALADDAGYAQAAQAQPVSTQAGQLAPHQMADIVSNYSMENGGRVGIFINIAPDTKLTPQQLGDAMVRKFAKDGIEAKYIFNYAKAGESSVTFYMNGLVWAGYSLGGIPEAYGEVVKSYRALKTERHLSGLSANDGKLALNSP